MTTHQASTEHDLSGLRDNFNPRARWRAAIAGARALHRFGSHGSRTSTSSKSSGGWKTTEPDIDSDDDSDGEHVDLEAIPKGVLHDQLGSPGQNDFVKVTPPDEKPHEELSSQTQSKENFSPNEHIAPATQTTAEKPADAHELKREHDAPHQLPEQVSEEPHEVHKSGRSNGHYAHHDSDDEELMMPGSFNVKPNRHVHGHLGFADLFRKLHLKHD